MARTCPRCSADVPEAAWVCLSCHYEFRVRDADNDVAPVLRKDAAAKEPAPAAAKPAAEPPKTDPARAEAGKGLAKDADEPPVWGPVPMDKTLLPEAWKRCPDCDAQIRAAAIVCPVCKKEMEPEPALSVAPLSRKRRSPLLYAAIGIGAAAVVALSLHMRPGLKADLSDIAAVAKRDPTALAKHTDALTSPDSGPRPPAPALAASAAALEAVAALDVTRAAPASKPAGFRFAQAVSAPAPLVAPARAARPPARRSRAARARAPSASASAESFSSISEWVFTGRLRDIFTLEPIRSADLVFEDYTANRRFDVPTDEEGRFHVRVPAAEGAGYFLKVSKTGYTDRYEFEGGEVARLDKEERSRRAAIAARTVQRMALAPQSEGRLKLDLLLVPEASE
ncbi:MAG: hypothetical protein NTX64_13640 [Elusimicrobia bacterium]|nr:hypothetical protein [Elusimicrobiota bacterium]